MQDETLLIRTLVELADTLVDDFDVVDLLTLLSDRCVDVLDVSAAGIMLVASEGDLHVVASSSEAMRIVELFELQSDEGPCVDCYHTGTAVVNLDLDRRPRALAPLHRGGDKGRFRLGSCTSHAAARIRYRRAQPIPLRPRCTGRRGRLRRAGAGRRRDDRHPPTPRRAAGERGEPAAQRGAQQPRRDRTGQGRDRRRARIDTDEAFSRLRQHARSNNLRLADVAREVAEGRLALEAFGGARPAASGTDQRHEG